MSLTLRVLGCATPYPRPDQPCSGYLLDSPNGRILIELGLAVWPELLRHTDPHTLDAIWVSHLHPDHSGDLLAAYQWAANTPGAPRLPVHGPTGWADQIGAALPGSDGPTQLRHVFDIHEHHTGAESIADLTIQALPVQHTVPTWGLRVTHLTGTLGYSADSAPCPALHTLANGADVFLCEAGTTTDHPGHCTPEQAAHIGTTAVQLILTHLPPDLNPHEATHRATGATTTTPGLTLTLQTRQTHNHT